MTAQTATDTSPSQGDRACGYIFRGTSNRCGADLNHPVHRRGNGRGGSAWPHIEEYHEFNHAHRFICECGEVR